MSTIFVSHNLNVVRLPCERVIVMNKGRTVESGNADQVLISPKEDHTRTLVNAIPHFEPERGTVDAPEMRTTAVSAE